MGSNFFNNRQLPAQQRRVKNRRDADKLIHSSYTAFLLLGTMALHDQFGFGGARLGKWIDKMNELKESRSSFRSDYMKCACMGCTEATGRSWDCHTRCDGYKEFQAKNEEEKNVIKRKNPYYKSLSKEKFMKRNALNRNRRGRK